MTNSNPSKKVLLLALSGIGNFLMQSPVFAAIKKAHPNWHITVWVAPRGTKELAKNNQNIDAVIEAPIKHYITDHLKLISHLRREKFDIALMLSPGQLWKGTLYMFLAGIPIRIAHTYPFLSRSRSRFLLTRAIPEDPNRHDLEQNLALLQLLNISFNNLPVTGYRLLLPDSTRHQASQFWSQLRIPENKLVIGIHPGSARGFEWKRWPLEYWIELGKTLIKKYNAFILIFGGPDEQETIEKLAAGLPAVASAKVGPPPSLLDTAALMQHCQLFIANDSGLMHLAAAAGVTTLGLFGPTNEAQTGPRGPHSYTLRAPGTRSVYHTEFNPALGSTPHASLLALTPAHVLDKISHIVPQ